VCLFALALSSLAIGKANAQVPSPWSATDIGSPTPAGSSSFDSSSGTFTIDAGGTDIWGTSDKFRFIYQQISGDADIIAKVDSITQADEWSKSGVMIRSSLAANAAHAYALLSAGRGVAFQRRKTVGGSSYHTAGGSYTYPRWVRLVRSGTTVTAYQSSNGSTWTRIGSDTIALGTTAYVGLATTSHNSTMLTETDVSNVSIVGQAQTNKPPTVSLTAPANGTSYTAPASITVSASASDPEGKMAKVAFYAGSTLLATDTTSPYSFTWSSVPVGTYSIKAVAYDTSGLTASSATVSVTVKTTTTTTPPRAVQFVASADHATLVTSYRLDVFASTADPNTATPIKSVNLGKPTPDSSGLITSDQSTFFSTLAVGSYKATVSALGSGGSSRSTAVTFVR
jgi:hypothetical protein